MSRPNPARRTATTPTATNTTQTIERATRTILKEGDAEPLIFGKANFLWMGIGAALILLGLLLMMGGGQPSPDVWDDNIIYSTRIVTVAPIVILTGLVIEIYAIFKD
jgi:Protein of unknown function (DUF3098)